MANSNIPTVQLTDTFNTQRNRFNSLVDSVGNVSSLTTTSKEVTGAIKELDAELGTITAGAMGTTATTVGTAIGEIDGRLDSINTTQLLSPRMTLSDSSATNIIRGNLQIDTNLSVKGDLTFENSLTVEDSAYITGTLALGSNLNVAGNTTVGGDTTFANTITVQDSAYVTGTLTTGNLNSGTLILDNNLTVHGIANLDSTNIVGQLDVTGNITATNFTVSGAFTTAGATRAANAFSVVNDGVTVTNTNRSGLAVDRPSLDSAVLQWNELGDFWEIGTNQTDGGSSSDMKRVARQNDSAVFTNLMQSGTGATRIPAGTTAQRPSSEQGQIRYNTTNSSFEGYSGAAWSGLGGLIDVDGDTKVVAERSAGNDSDTLTFFTTGVERLRINDSGSTFATNITMTGSATVDGRDVATDGTKLDTISTNANNFTLPLSTSATRGGVKVGYTDNGKNYAVELSSEKMYVNVPWTDTQSATYSHPNHSGDVTSSGDGATTIGADKVTYAKMQNVSATDRILGRDTAGAGNVEEITPANLRTMLNVANGANAYSLPAASSSTRGGVKTGYTESGKNYPVEVSSEKMFVNVPWTDNNTVFTHPTHPGDDINIDTGALSGATVISDLDFNVTTDTLGHVTDANATVSTRSLTAANVGALPTNALSLGRASAITSGATLFLNSGSGTGAVHLQSSQATKAQFDYKQTSGYGEINFYTRNQIGASDTTPLALTIRNEDITVQGDVNSVSDVRTKENIVTVESGLDLVSQLRGVWYNKIGKEDRKVGVIAQEVEEVLPEVVNTDEDGMKSVDYSKMVGVLIEAIKELKQEIDELKGK